MGNPPRLLRSVCLPLPVGQTRRDAAARDQPYGLCRVAVVPPLLSPQPHSQGTTLKMDKDIRDRLQNVFGNYSDFCHTLSNTASNLTRHGVLQNPPTPVASRAPAFPPRSQSPVAAPSARECVNVMSDLVPSSPLQPPNLAHLMFHRDPSYSSNPASSTRSSPDESEAKKKKRKHRNPDSDSEVEKRKRHKEHSELSKPSTSRERPQDDDAMKELFGDDMAKPSGSEKGVSPDSGVHSTENEGNEENDINSIIATMSSLLPMLSPVTERPLDKQGIRDKEKERKEKEERERERKEKEEKRRKEQELRAAREEKAREEAKKRLEEERKAVEEKERKAAEERRVAEERDRRAAEERERKVAEERRLAEERRERQKREEEAAAEKALRERMAASPVNQPLAEASNRLTGVLPLHLLSSEKMSKLMDLGRKHGKLETKSDRPKSPLVSADVVKKKRDRDETENVKKSKKDKVEAESSTERPISPLVTAEAAAKKRREREEKGANGEKVKAKERLPKAMKRELRVEPGSSTERPQSPLVTAETVKKHREEANGDTPKKLAKNDVRATPETSVPSPRPGSSLSGGKDFRCACNEVLPVKPVRPNIPSEKPDELLQNHAKSLKRKADQTTDHVKKILLYLESIVYFALGARFLPSIEKSGSRKASIFRDTADLAKQTTSRFAHSESLTPLQHHFISRVRALSIRAQAILAFNSYQAKAPNVLKSFHLVELHESGVVFNRAEDGAGDVRSPGSVHSSSNHSTNSTVTMPLDTYQMMKSQLKVFQHVMWAHKLWADAGHLMHKNPTDTLFINSLESLCGSMCVTTPVEKASHFFLTGIAWLREEYELELKRPPPPPPTPVQSKK